MTKEQLEEVIESVQESLNKADNLRSIKQVNVRLENAHIYLGQGLAELQSIYRSMYQ